MIVTVLLMAFAVSFEPFRIGMTVLMLSRPKPALQLLAFLVGGFAMGTTVGLVVLFIFRRMLLGSTYFTLPRVQVLIGLLFLTVAVIVAADVPRRLGLRPDRFVTPAQRLMRGDSLSVAGIAGLSIALPSVDYLAALAVILASGAAALTPHRLAIRLASARTASARRKPPRGSGVLLVRALLCFGCARLRPGFLRLGLLRGHVTLGGGLVLLGLAFLLQRLVPAYGPCRFLGPALHVFHDAFDACLRSRFVRQNRLPSLPNR